MTAYEIIKAMFDLLQRELLDGKPAKPAEWLDLHAKARKWLRKNAE